MAERIERAADYVRACTGADLVVLPELWAHGAWATDSWSLTAEGIDGPVVSALCAAAQAAGVHLHGGSILERADGQLYNTAILIGPDGTLQGQYRKIHRFGFDTGEAAVLAPGTKLTTWTLPAGVAGVATCYDLRFPELFRGLVDAGAKVFLIASSWPQRRVAHWRLLTRARAVENLAFLVATDACGTQCGVVQAGESLVVDPWGEVLAEGGRTETVLDVEIDLARVDAVRTEFPALRDRRL